MKTEAPASSYGGERRRYVKVPETAHVKDLRDLWETESADLDPLMLVGSLLLASHRLTIGRYRVNHWYASVVSDVPRAEGWPNALSGWGKTPDQAIRELGFRWSVLMRGTWRPEGWNLNALPIWVKEGS